MITKADYSFIEDVSEPNTVLRVGVTSGLHLSAAVWTTPRIDSMAHARLDGLHFALYKVVNRLPLWQLWVVVGHKAIHPDNKISRYNGIWKSLSKRGMNLPPGDCLEDFEATSLGIRFFGAARFELGHLEWVHKLLSSEQAAIIITNNDDSRGVMTNILRRGLALQNTKPPRELLEVCDQKLMIIDEYGEFDDPDVSVAAIGRKEIVIDLNA